MEYWVRENAILQKQAWWDLIGLVMEKDGNIYPIREEGDPEERGPTHFGDLLSFIQDCGKGKTSFIEPECSEVLSLLRKSLPEESINQLMSEDAQPEDIPALMDDSLIYQIVSVISGGEWWIRVAPNGEVGVDVFEEKIPRWKIKKLQEYLEKEYAPFLYGSLLKGECTVVFRNVLYETTFQFTVRYGEDWVKAAAMGGWESY